MHLTQETSPKAASTSISNGTVNGSAGPGASNGGNEKTAVSRKERTKSRDFGKCMGGGQKGLWVSVTENLARTTVPAALDEHDPNYDSENDTNVVLVSDSTKCSKENQSAAHALPIEMTIHPSAEIKKQVSTIIEEYFISGDANEVRNSLKELEAEEFKYEIVKRGITMSMDKHEKERELMSRLLSELYLNGLTRNQLFLGLRRALLLSDDLEIDIPNAKTMLAIFVARAVVDEIIPPSFLEDSFITRYASNIAEEAIQKLSIKHGTARMVKSWGPGDGRPVEELKIAIDQLTKEFLLSRDFEEASHCVRELNVAHFHHEAIKRGIMNALEEGGKENTKAMGSLFAFLVTQEIVSVDQLRKGFERFRMVLDDVKLDIPSAELLFQGIVSQAIDDGILPHDF